VTASDRDIICDVRHGDRDAFAALVHRYQNRLFGLLLMMVREPGGAEEITQDAFVRAYSHLDRFDDQQPFYPWLAAIAVRLAQNWWGRHGKTIRREGVSLDSAPEPASAAGALVALIADEGNRRLWHAVARLPAAERTAVVLYYRDEMPVRDVARVLGVTIGTIKTLLFRARRHLRRQLESGPMQEERST
jgi:RNA polymerase sigma-70 factor (ECF subfamily)